MDEKKILLDSIKSIRQQARVCEERRESYLLMFKKAIKKGNMDGVRINLENVIDMRDWQTTYLKCASRLDSLLAWFGIKAKMTTIDTMASNIKSLESTLATVAGNLQEMSETMDSFLNREVQAKFMVSYNAIKEGNKDLQRMSKSLQGQLIECKKEEKSEMLKVKKATEKGNMEGAQIYAENAIRKRTEQMNYLKLVSLLDVVMGQVDTLPMMGTISDSMALIEFLKSTLSTVAGNLQEMSETMVQFDKQFVNMESFMAGSTLLSTPEEGEVNSLIQQVADDYELQLFLGLPRPAALGVPVQVPEKVDVDDLSRRLAELKARQ